MACRSDGELRCLQAHLSSELSAGVEDNELAKPGMLRPRKESHISLSAFRAGAEFKENSKGRISENIMIE